jgi:hypothetical protein
MILHQDPLPAAGHPSAQISQDVIASPSIFNVTWQVGLTAADALRSLIFSAAGLFH